MTTTPNSSAGDATTSKPVDHASRAAGPDVQPRAELEKAVITAVLNLFGETGSAAFSLPIPGTTPPLYIVVSENREIR